MLLCDAGEDKIVTCNECNYSANMDVAVCLPQEPATTNLEELKEVNTPETKTIDGLEEFLNIPRTHFAKAVVYYRIDTDETVIVFIRGDKEVNEAKLKKATKKDIVPFSAENDSRLCAGNIGPIGLNLDSDCVVVYDNSIKGAVNMICGANKAEYHLINVCVERDLSGAQFVDIAKVQEGDTCPICGGKVKIVHGIEIGNIFQLGTKYTKSMDMTVHSEDGGEFNPIMGCYGIGVGRSLACIIEDNHDDYGIIMPKEVAPFMVHICPLRLDNETVKTTAENIYKTLEDNNISCIYDDREVSAGNKFADADLMGMPLRIVVSQKGLDENKVEIKIRATGEVIKTEPENVLKTIKDLI
jgi:prolyl-tRNA synthetase